MSVLLISAVADYNYFDYHYMHLSLRIITHCSPKHKVEWSLYNVTTIASKMIKVKFHKQSLQSI